MGEPIRAFGLDAVPDEVTPVPRSTVLDSLRAQIASEHTEREVVLPVKSRPGWSVRYATSIRYEELQAWRKKATDKTMPGGINELRVCATILANQCRAILAEGEEPEDAAGEPLTFTSQEILDATGALRPIEAVRAFYGGDAYVIKAAGALLIEAGYDPDDDAGPDPTRAS